MSSVVRTKADCAVFPAGHQRRRTVDEFQTPQGREPLYNFSAVFTPEVLLNWVANNWPEYAMSAFVMEQYSPETSRDRSPDEMSALFPDRPIRPLPKRKLRERLSPDVASTITYPPAPPTTTPLFYYPYSLNGEEDRPRGEQYQIDRQKADEVERNYIPKNKIEEVLESDDESAEVGPNRGRAVHHSPDPKGKKKAYRYVQKAEASKHHEAELPASTSSSVDGYDSFENTNNKKKRKIPTAGEMGSGGPHSTNDALLSTSHELDDQHGRVESVEMNALYYGSPGSANGGLSGPGRGRYGRVRAGRSPMRTLPDANSRTPRQRQQWPISETLGIISTAIANAEKLPQTPTRGQENVSLLQQASQRQTPASTQFTFTCDSQVPGTVAWPETSHRSSMAPYPVTRTPINTRATQTSPNSLQPGPQLPALNEPYSDPKMAAKPKKARRRTGKEYIIAARQRREQQEYQNYHHPPAPEDEWICEFCEYERIFGTPPEALIKQYEIKDRRLRKQEAERRRLLEKAKMKGRKGRKGSKATAKTSPVQHSQQAQQPHHVDADLSRVPRSHGTQSEEYYEDEYDEDYGPDDQPLSSPLDQPHNGRLHGELIDPQHRVAAQGGAGKSELLVS